MDEFKKETLKDHVSGILKMFYCHILAVCLGWVAYPLILLLLVRNVTIDVPMSVYSIFVTVIYILLLLAQSNDLGTKDRRPYKRARYKAKGFVFGAVGGVIVVLLEVLFIAVADKFFMVQHPQFLISGVNAYVRMLLYVPLFWFYSLLNATEAIMPHVTYLSSLVIIPFMSAFSGLGYLLGISGITLDLGIKRRRK